MLEPHILKTGRRIEAEKSEYILAIQDSTYLNYTSHKAKTSLGKIGLSKQTNQYGLIQHNTLCVTEKNEPLGLIDLQFCDYENLDTKTHRHHRNTEETVLDRWIRASESRRKILPNTNKKIVTVADREGDFFAFINDLIFHNDLFVIRARHNRYLGKNHRDRGKKLFELLEEEKELGKITIDINDVHTRQIKKITLKLKCLKDVILPFPRRSKERNRQHSEAIKVNVLMASNDDYCWILLTNLPVNNTDEMLRVIQIYKCRWHIEDFHKILKTAYQIEEIYLHSSRQAIENALTMAAISACRFYWMVYVGRIESECKADHIFKEYEWKTVYIYFKETVPKKPPLLSEIILRIARMGGHKMKNKLPGIKTMWIGFQSFSVATTMCKRMLRSIKT